MSDVLERKYWPYKTRPAEELTAEQRVLINFLETAFDEGFHPFNEGGDSYLEAASASRGAGIVRRYRIPTASGRERVWELRLADLSQATIEQSSFTYPPLVAFAIGLAPATDAALKWLRGQGLETILTELKGSLDLARGYRLNGEKKHL